MVVYGKCEFDRSLITIWVGEIYSVHFELNEEGIL